MPICRVSDPILWLRVIALATCLSPLLFASSPPGDDSQSGPGRLKSLSLEQLSEIPVTSVSKQPAPAFRSPAAVYVITGDDIRRAGVTSIPDALRLAPGVEVARIDGSKWSVGIRGFGTRLSRSVLVLIDGRTVYTPLVAGTYWEVQDTLLEDIDRIEVIRGPGGTIWGPNAVQGVINIITRTTRDTNGMYASVGGGNVDQAIAQFRYGGGTPDGVTYRIYGKAFTRGPEFHSDSNNFDDWRGGQTGFRADWGNPNRDNFTVQGDLYRQQDGEQVGLSTYTPPANLILQGNEELSGANVRFNWKRTFNSSSDFQLQAYYDRTHRDEPNLGENRDTFDVDFLQRNRVSSRHQILYGLGLRFSAGRFSEVGSGLVFSPAHRFDYLASGFLQDDVTLVGKRLILTLGSKVFRSNYTGFEVEPSARLLWTPSDSFSVWASFTHALRAPSDAEEDFYLSSWVGTLNGLPYYARFNANPDFSPEKLNGYELGLRHLVTKKFYVDVSSFYNHYHDLFSQDITGGPFLESSLPFPEPTNVPTHYILTAQFENDLFGFAKGIEIAPEYRPFEYWRLRGSYSYLHMDLQRAPRLELGGSPASITGASPAHQVVLDSAWDVSRLLQVDLIYRYVSALPALQVRSYSTGDARISWRLNSHFDLSVVGQNLLQPYHVESGPEPSGLPVSIKRGVYATLEWRTR